MTKLSRIRADHRDAGTLHELVNLFGFVDERTFLTKSGDLGVVIAVQGVDDECLDPDQINRIARRFEATLKVFDERFRIHQYLLKRDDPEIPHRDYPDNPVLQQAVAARVTHLQSKSRRLYSLDTNFVVLYQSSPDERGLGESLARLVRNPLASFREAFGSGCRVAAIESEIEDAREILCNRVGSLLIQLRDLVEARLLDKHEAFRFFRRLLNYTPHQADGVALKYDVFLDYFACDETLECHRDHLRLDDWHVKVLTLKEPPAQTFANLLSGLQDIPSNFIMATEWVREDNHATRRAIQSARRHHHNSKYSLLNYVLSPSDRTPPHPSQMLLDDSAEALVADLGSGLKEMEIEGRHFGRFSLTVVLYDRDRAALEAAVAECFKVFSTHDATLIEERYNLINAWLAVLPGNYIHNLRHLYLTNTNYADLAFLFAPHTGEARNAHLGAEYLAVLETERRTPYFLNLHHRDIAHTLILGATGSGKSFLLNFLLTNAQKYDPLTFIFDLGGSYEHVARLFGGSYLPIGVERQAFTINPFCLPPTPDNLQFLFSFVSVLIQAGGYRMTYADERDLFQQIESLYEVAPEQRRLFTLSNIVYRSLRERLQRWVQGGQYAALFDNVEDNLTLSSFQAFEFEGLDQYPQVLEPLLFYILHRAGAAIHGPENSTRFKLFVMDEAWRFLRDPAIKLYITEALKTWRKRNAAMVLATQSSDDIARGDMMHVVAESCPTKMFLSNPGMDRELYRELFHLNETEARLIEALTPKRQILVKRPDAAKVLNLDVAPVSYWLYTNDPFDNQRRREALQQFGFEEGLRRLAQQHPSRSTP